MKLLDQFTRDETPMRLPVMIGDGVTVSDDGVVYGWVELPARSTDDIDTMDLFMETSKGAMDLRTLIPVGAEGHFKIQWRQWTGDEYLANELYDGMTTGQREYIELGAERIDGVRFPRRQVLLGVRFDENAPGRRDNAAVAGLRKLIGLRDEHKEARGALEVTVEMVHSWIARMAASSFGARAATVQQLSWALRRDLHRTWDWLPEGSVAGPGEIARLTAAAVSPRDDHVEIMTDTGVRFLRMLTIAGNGFPTSDLSLPGSEWLKSLSIDGAGEPVEVSIRFRNVPKADAVKRMEAALTLAKEQDRSARHGIAEQAPQHIADAQATMAARIEEVRKNKVGMIEDTVTWVIEADTLKDLKKRTTAAIDFYNGMGISIWEAPAIQDLLYMELITGDKRRIPEFAQFRPWDTVVGAWFHGGSALGAEQGYYLAANMGSTPGPFINRLSDAQLEGNPITTVSVGQSGAGKSTAVMLSLLAEVVMGGWGALTDFKGDLKGICEAARMFDVPVTHISTDQVASGSLCPFRWVPDVKEAASLSVDNLTMALEAANSAGTESLVRKAANRVANYPAGKIRSSHAVIGELLADENPAAKELGGQLVELAQDPLARPVLGEPDLSARSLTTDPGLVYMRFVGMRWPGKDSARQDWKPGHRLTVMLVQSGFAYLTYMAGRVKGIPKTVALTELHYILRYDFGREFVGELAMTGRALDVNQLLDTQGCRQLLLVPDLLDQVSQIHCFSVRTPGEADAQADLLGLQPSAGFRDQQIVTNQRAGVRVCITKDRQGRIAPIQFDYMTAEIEQALQTTPDRVRPAVPPATVPPASEEEVA